MNSLFFLFILSCYNPVTLVGDVSSLEIYNDVNTEYLYVKFSSDTSFRRLKSAEYGQPLRFNYCSDNQVIIRSDNSEKGSFQKMLVLINSDTIYNSWRFTHEIVINLNTQKLEK